MRASEPNEIIISVVVPVFKEEKNIQPFLHRLLPVLKAMGNHEVIFCLDPSPDHTEQIILQEAANNPAIKLITFSRRFGQPAASLAGIKNCSGNYCVVIDVDLQDPPELIKPLYDKAQEGFDVVYAKRLSREGETLIKKFIAYLGYNVINRLSDIEIPRNTGDFRIINRRVIDEISKLKESHGFFRGLIALIGFKQTSIDYKRSARHSGTGNYNRLFGSLKIGLNGLIGFSNLPLSLLMYLGIIILCGSIVGSGYIVIARFVLGQSYPLGTPSILIVLFFLTGLSLFSIGLLGEYIGRIYDEVKQRPLYIVDQAVNIDIKDKYGR